MILDEGRNEVEMKRKEIVKEGVVDLEGRVIVVCEEGELVEGVVRKVYELGKEGVKEDLCGIYELVERKKMENLEEVEGKNG